MKLVYLGTPALAVPPLHALLAAGHEVALVVSQPDKRRGRGKTLTASPVKAAAVELGLPVTDNVDDVLDVGAELGVVVAFGQLIKPHVLSAVPMVNLHFSLLPRWRGAAPVERAILAGDPTTGVCVMDVVDELDAGGVHTVAEVPIGPNDTLEGLRSELVEVGTRLLVATLDAGLGTATPQQGEIVYAKKVQRDELRLDLTKPAIDVLRTIRLGGAWSEFRDKRLRIWRAEVVSPSAEGGPLEPGQLVADLVGTGDGALRLDEVQPEGKQRMDATSWRNGAQPQPGERLQ